MAEFSDHSRIARRLLSGMSLKDASNEVKGKPKAKSEALRKKKENYDKPGKGYEDSFRRGKIPPHARGSMKELKKLSE